MKPAKCARKWQIEAVRDGRLRGKDLDSAQRHQITCAVCANEARELATLTSAIARLPKLSRDPVTVRRTRQQLLSTLNQAVLKPSTEVTRGQVAIVFAGLSVALVVVGSAIWNRQKPMSPAATARESTSFVEVHPTPGARWSEQLDHTFDRIDLTSGSASFRVRPHQGRRVIIRLPDGEIEDIGTVFEVLVQEGRTKHVAVSEGRVALRLRGRAEATVSAGESWDSEPEGTAAEAVAAPGEAPAAHMVGNAHASAHALRPSPPTIDRAGARPSAASAEDASKPDAASARAEDDAYLHIVTLLREGKQSQARAEAERYILRFPTGFRRVEVLNIATRAGE